MILKLLSFVAISIGVTLVIAGVLILSQWPKALDGKGGLDFERTLKGTLDARPTEPIAMRDGYDLQVRRYQNGVANAPLLILVHGSAWHGLQFDGLASRLSAVADVVVPDLRGHGAKPGRHGDVDYIGQLEDDLADLIKATRKEGQKVVLGGHSSGGGLVVRFAGGTHGATIDKAVLLAPFLKHDAPTFRPDAGGWSQVLLRRIIGLSMLNALKIRAFNGLTIIQFNMPKQVLDSPLGYTATTAYSYRLNISFAPRSDYLADVAALPEFLLIAGSADEAFDAALFEPTMSAVTAKGKYRIIDGIKHLDIVDTQETAVALEEFLNDD